jgi:hypothetical protein
MQDLTPKMSNKGIPTKAVAAPPKPRETVEGPHVNVTPRGLGKYTSKTTMKKGGLLRDVNQEASFIGH